MRTVILTLTILALAAIPSKASVSFTEINLTLDGPGFDQSIDGTSLDDTGSSADGWTLTADLITNATAVDGGFTVPGVLAVDLTDFTLVCDDPRGCAATTIGFGLQAFTYDGDSVRLPWQVSIAGTTNNLNATFQSSLPDNTVDVSGNRSFDFVTSGSQIFFSGDVSFNASIAVARGSYGESLTLPFNTTLGTIPEPATLGLTGLALAGLGLTRFRRRKIR